MRMEVPIVKVTVVKQIIAEIVNSILEDRLCVGDKLATEREMSKKWQVSRASVHSAVQILAYNQILSVRQGSGIYLNKLPEYIFNHDLPAISEKQMEFFDKMEARLVIECQAIRLAATRRDAEDLAEMEGIINNMAEILKKNPSAGYSIEDLNFHNCIVKACKNRTLYDIACGIWRDLPEWYLGYGNIDELEKTSFLQHKMIIQAITERDVSKCEELLADHVMFATKSYRKRLFDNP